MTTVATEALLVPDFHAPVLTGDRPLEVNELTTATEDQIISSINLWAGFGLYGQYVLGRHLDELRARMKGQGWTSWITANSYKFGGCRSQIYNWLHIYEALDAIKFFDGLTTAEALAKAGQLNLQDGAIAVLARPGTPNQAREEILKIASSGAIVKEKDAAAIAHMVANPETKLIDVPEFTIQDLKELVAPHWEVTAMPKGAVQVRCLIPNRGSQYHLPSPFTAKGWWEQQGAAKTERALWWNQFPVGSRVTVADGAQGRIMRYDDTELMAYVLIDDQDEEFPIPFTDLQVEALPPSPTSKGWWEDGSEAEAPKHSGVLRAAIAALNTGDMAGAAKALRTAAKVVQHGHSAGVLQSSGEDMQETPERLWQAALEAMNCQEFDLDAASHASSPIPAARIFTKEDDALTKDWIAKKAFLNAPFSLQEKFTHKLIQEYKSGRVEEAVCLSKLDSRTAWWSEFAGTCTAFCIVTGYDKFHKPEECGGENKHSSFFSTVMWYFGPNVRQFFYAFNSVGVVAQELTPEKLGG